MELMRDEFWSGVMALDRLNSWVRSMWPYWSHVQSTLTPVIYWTKTQAILEASRRWHIGMRRVMVKRPCRRCDATGSWIPRDADWYEDLSVEEYRANYGERCRGCAGTGTAVLKFVESRIGPVRWHTPAHKWHSSSLDVYVPFPCFIGGGDEMYDEAQDWEPQRPGRSMTAAEVHRDMLILLQAYPHHVAFALDYHYHTKIERRYGYPALPVAREFLDRLFERDRLLDEMQAPILPRSAAGAGELLSG